MNTKITYQYRDGSNWKQFKEVILFGEISTTGRAKLYKHCDEGEWFIPSQVGLEDLQHLMTGFPGGDDHVWHELIGFEFTEEPPTEVMTSKEFVTRFLKTKWDVVNASKQLGIKFEKKAVAR